MGRNLEKDSAARAEKNRRILSAGFQLFAAKGIERVSMNDVAGAAGVGIASLYRYYNTKEALVLAIGTWAWDQYVTEQAGRLQSSGIREKTAAENVDFYLEAFLDLYRYHKDLLRFNQFFNVFVQCQQISGEETEPYNAVIRALEERFGSIYRKGQRDGTLCSVPEEVLFSTLTHLMLAAVTRYAVGLVYHNEETNAERELNELKECLLRRFCTPKSGRMEERA